MDEAEPVREEPRALEPEVERACWPLRAPRWWMLAPPVEAPPERPR
ncbi:hypothetical protein [Amycolatopsis sp. CA-230715]|nr:hypothetical protein [Amycolatopsis sp. CA-230715]